MNEKRDEELFGKGGLEAGMVSGEPEVVACEAGADEASGDSGAEEPGNASAGRDAEGGDEPEADGQEEPTACNGTSPDDSSELERRIAEAEERGYLRGRNERIEELMKGRPGMRQDVCRDGTEGLPILRKIRESVWR